MPIFEVKKTDLAARIGRLQTRNGVIETPAILPVIHPFKQTIRPELIEKMGFNAIMTNSYLMLRKNRMTGKSYEVHSQLGFQKTIMTDSGAYQMLKYGEIETTPHEIVEFEQSIGSDIGVILDTPTGLTRDRRKAEETVEKTIKAAIESVPYFKEKQTLWTGPIQGGMFYDLIEESARKMVKLNFDVYALGSPTQVMEQYDFEHLVKMIVSARKNIPLDKPLHLFGAGHPLTLPLAVALGCDMFDSASYVLYARRGAYMTEYGTQSLKDMEFLPCECEICSRHTAKEIRESADRVELVSLHNLHVLAKEIKSIKQAIFDGKLWEYVATKSRAHPRTWTAFKTFKDLYTYFADGTPVFKTHGLNLCSTPDQYRPEAIRPFDRIISNISIDKDVIIIYLSTTNNHEFLYSLRNTVNSKLGKKAAKIQFCMGIFPIAIVPLEICDIYPFSQYDISLPLDDEMTDESIRRFKIFLLRYRFKNILIIDHSNGRYEQFLRWFKKGRKIPEKKVIEDRQMENIIAVIMSCIKGP